MITSAQLTDAIHAILTAGSTGTSGIGIYTLWNPDTTQCPAVTIGPPAKGPSMLVFGDASSPGSIGGGNGSDDYAPFKVKIETYEVRKLGATAAQTVHQKVINDLQNVLIDNYFISIEETEGPTGSNQATGQYFHSVVTVKAMPG
jgi:hypothetical protein